MNKFKVGDKVIQVKSPGAGLGHWDLPNEVVKVAASSITGLRFVGKLRRGYDASRFELVGAVGIKDTNPKDACGIKKVPLSCISKPVLAELGVAMFEGARKYGRHNYRVSKVRASVYCDAADRHMMAWYEGQDIDPDSGLSHVTKAIASLVVLRDAMIQDQLVDDRPPKSKDNWMEDLQPIIDALFEKYPEAKEAFTNEETK